MATGPKPGVLQKGQWPQPSHHSSSKGLCQLHLHTHPVGPHDTDPGVSVEEVPRLRPSLLGAWTQRVYRGWLPAQRAMATCPVIDPRYDQHLRVGCQRSNAQRPGASRPPRPLHLLIHLTLAWRPRSATAHPPLSLSSPCSRPTWHHPPQTPGKAGPVGFVPRTARLPEQGECAGLSQRFLTHGDSLHTLAGGLIGGQAHASPTSNSPLLGKRSLPMEASPASAVASRTSLLARSGLTPAHH